MLLLSWAGLAPGSTAPIISFFAGIWGFRYCRNTRMYPSSKLGAVASMRPRPSSQNTYTRRLWRQCGLTRGCSAMHPHHPSHASICQPMARLTAPSFRINPSRHGSPVRLCPHSSGFREASCLSRRRLVLGQASARLSFPKPGPKGTCLPARS